MSNEIENKKTDYMLDNIAGRNLKAIKHLEKRDGVLLDVAPEAVAVACAVYDFLGFVDMGIECGAFAADSEYVAAAEKLREDIDSRMQFAR